MPQKLKVITVVGTRPEIIRLACTIKRLDEFCDHKLVHTGQNYDYELNEIFFKDLQLRKPDYYLNVDTSSLGKVLGETLIKVEEVFKAEQPDAIVILGDTNASIAAIMARRMKIPIYHMEAGNRSFDFNVPEEINRRIIDHTADFNLVYTENSRRHLLAEGLPHRKVYVTGSPMWEVITTFKEQIENSDALTRLNLNPKDYFLVSVHREENVDHKPHLRQVVTMLNNLAAYYNKRVIVSTHPRTRKRLEALEGIELDTRVEYLKPFGFFDYVRLQQQAMCVISDSGTISEESSMLNFAAVTIRNSMERPEALDAGTIVLTGLESDNVLRCVDLVIKEFAAKAYDAICPEYQVTNTSWRVVKLIMGTAGLAHRWDGIFVPER